MVCNVVWFFSSFRITTINSYSGKQWNEIQPTKSDFALLANTCYHSEFVTNVCSSTVFDFVIHNKPCLYYNYEQPQMTYDKKTGDVTIHDPSSEKKKKIINWERIDSKEYFGKPKKIFRIEQHGK